MFYVFCSTYFFRICLFITNVFISNKLRYYKNDVTFYNQLKFVVFEWVDFDP